MSTVEVLSTALMAVSGALLARKGWHNYVLKMWADLESGVR